MSSLDSPAWMKMYRARMGMAEEPVEAVANSIVPEGEIEIRDPNSCESILGFTPIKKFKSEQHE